MKLVFLGPPGAGKGTQAVRLCEQLNLVHVSTGDMLRAEIAAGTQIGLLAKSLINDGHLVPDEIVIDMVHKRLCEESQAKGFVFDGFPRTVSQAKLLTEKEHIDLVLNIDVPYERLLDRIMHRRSCTDCKGNFYMDDLTVTTCPVCNGKLIVRDDDKETVLQERYKVYQERTMPIIDFYSSLGCLVTIDGDKPIDMVAEQVYLAANKLFSENQE